MRHQSNPYAGCIHGIDTKWPDCGLALPVRHQAALAPEFERGLPGTHAMAPPDDVARSVEPRYQPHIVQARQKQIASRHRCQDGVARLRQRPEAKPNF